jgi:hypothetical protein
VSSAEANEYHFWLVASRMLAGRVVPFLGAGANLCGRPKDQGYELGRYLPSGDELAKILAEASKYPDCEHLDLLQVSQYFDAVLGQQILYEQLRQTFNADYPPTTLHESLALIPAIVRERAASPPLLVLTTNYDDAMERALEDKDEPYELLWYEAKPGESLGHFVHRTPTGPQVIDRPNEYDRIDLGATVIVKLHGAVDRTNPDGDSYVITEDDYIGYLARTDIAAQLPAVIRQHLNIDHFLFLGYSLRDWNLRVILTRIWGKQKLAVKSWAIQRALASEQLGKIEQRLWEDRGDVEVLYIELDGYATGLRESLEAQVNPPTVAP